MYSNHRKDHTNRALYISEGLGGIRNFNHDKLHLTDKNLCVNGTLEYAKLVNNLDICFNLNCWFFLIDWMVLNPIITAILLWVLTSVAGCWWSCGRHSVGSWFSKGNWMQNSYDPCWFPQHCTHQNSQQVFRIFYFYSYFYSLRPSVPLL